jgi:hypothetical protein
LYVVFFFFSFSSLLESNDLVYYLVIVHNVASSFFRQHINQKYLQIITQTLKQPIIHAFILLNKVKYEILRFWIHAAIKHLRLAYQPMAEISRPWAHRPRDASGPRCNPQ